MDPCWQSSVSAFNMLPRLVITFLPRSKRLLISWLQLPSAVILEPRKIKSATVSPSICHEVMGLLQEQGPLPGPETGLLSNTRKWIVRGGTCADKARDFIGKGRPGGEQEGQGTQENCSAAWLTVSGFMVMGLVSRWSLANHSNSESFLVAHTHRSAKMDASERDSGKWTDTQCLLLTFPKLFRLAGDY